MSRRLTHLSRLILACAVLGISYLAFTPLQHRTMVQTWDKANHFAAFFVLALLFDSAWPAMGSHRLPKIAILFAYGIFIEAVQSVIPNRHFSLYDVIADAIGIGIYYLVVMVVLALRAPATVDNPTSDT